jgi:high-affinity iron transporter
MLQALIITLREGVEAALVIGIAAAYLKKIQRADLLRWVYLALGAAVAASLGIGYGFAKLNWNQDRFEGWIMLAAAAMVASLVYAMWRTGKTMRTEVESGLARAFSSRAAAPGLFLFVFLLVLREGAETVLLLSAVGLNSNDLWEAAGTFLGLTLAVIFGVLFVRGSLRINLPKFFRMTTVILLFVVVQLTISGLHELSEQGVIPSTRQIMATIGPIVRNEAFFFVTILALVMLMVLMDWRNRAAQPANSNAAERRLAEWTARRERMWATLVSASAFVFIVMVTAEFIYAKNKATLSPAHTVDADGQGDSAVVRVPLQEIADGDLHRYEVDTPAGKVRFFLIARPGMDPGVAIDACDICGNNGYYRKGTSVLCKNCGAAIFVPSIGTQGGCNPISLQHSINNGEVRIPISALAQQAHIFGPSKARL